MSVLNGGKFGHGFASSFLSKYIGTELDLKGNYSGEEFGNAFSRTMIAGIIGGTVSAATGGKFANGAMQSAIQWAFNAENGLWNEDPLQNNNEQMAEISGPKLKLKLGSKEVVFSSNGIERATFSAFTVDGKKVDINLGNGLSVDSQGNLTVSVNGKIYRAINATLSASSNGELGLNASADFTNKLGDGLTVDIVQVKLNLSAGMRNIVRGFRRAGLVTPTEMKTGGRMRLQGEPSIVEEYCRSRSFQWCS